MSSGVFRGKESLNRIELSRLVQDLLNFGVLGSLQLWGSGRWMGGVLGHLGAWGVPHMCTCPHMDARTCMHMYTCIEIANGCQHGGIHVYHVYNMFNMHVCAYMHIHACKRHHHTHPSPPPPIPTSTPIHPSATSKGGPPESVKIQ